MRIAKNIVFVFMTWFLSPLNNGLLAEKRMQTDTICSHVIHFKQNSSVVDTGYVNNNYVLKTINRLLYDAETLSKISSINISCSASPDGVYEHNLMLASRRSRVLKSYFVWKHPDIDQRLFKLHSEGENWKGLLDCVTHDPNVPNKDKVIEIINQDINTGTKKWRLQNIGNGESWEYIEKNIIKQLRTVSIDILTLKEKVESDIVDVQTPITEDTLSTASTSTSVSDTVKTKPQTEPEPKTETILSEPKRYPFLALKTNLAAYVFGVANLAVEVPFAKKFSVDIPVYYSPYTLAQNYKFRILALEPELKYWFKQPFKGHAIGIHGAAVMYNIAFNDRDRFQNTNGENFVYGGGISYGYTMNLKKNWNIEFTAGFGYLHLDHDVFRNVDNGALYDNRKFHYWGPTKLGVNIIYLFNK